MFQTAKALLLGHASPEGTVSRVGTACLSTSANFYRYLPPSHEDTAVAEMTVTIPRTARVRRPQLVVAHMFVTTYGLLYRSDRITTVLEISAFNNRLGFSLLAHQTGRRGRIQPAPAWKTTKG